MIEDRLSVGLPDVEATIMAAAQRRGPGSALSFRPARSDEGSYGEEDHTAC